MKYFAVTIFLVIISSAICNAQSTETSNSNAVSFELGKTGLIYNLTFDHTSAIKKLGYRFSVGSDFAKYLNAFSVGGGGYVLAGKTRHFFEVGLDLQYMVVEEVSNDQKGFAFVYPDYSVKSFFPSINLGYREYNKRSLLRIGLSPGLIDKKFVPGGYISYGLYL